ncbi:MAG: hypothetical protein AABW49_04740 [Nanoarchaeota archaeon]
MAKLKIFKIEYNWYEGEHGEILLAKDAERGQFENDLSEAKRFAEKLKGKKIKEGEYLGEGYRIECLPEFFEQIIFFLKEKKQYIECNFNNDISYFTDDDSNKKINITKSEKIIKNEELKC